MKNTKERCVVLRNKGFTLGEIIKTTKLPKTTIYYHIKDIPLPTEVIERIKNESTKRINEFNIKIRKGKCAPGRIVPKPKRWTNELRFLIAHFMFDGEIQTHSCIYHNRNKTLIHRVSFLMKKVFKLQPHRWLNKGTGVHRVSYHYVELADYMRERVLELKNYIGISPRKEKRIFLKAFFDDEGSVGFERKLNKRRIRGYQHNLEILKLIQKLLQDFDIESKIDEKYKEIVISRKPNLIKFRDRINFSKGIYINPARKNSIWKKKLEKRKILDYLINSYQK